MSDVQFEEENNGLTGFTSRKILGDRVTPKMAKALIKLGLAKNPKQAEYILISTCIISIILAIFVYVYFVVGYSPFAKKLSDKPHIQFQNLPVNNISQ